VLHIAVWAASVALAALPCLADDTAVLRNGFSIRHEHRQVIGTMTRLYLNRDEASFVDVPTEQIDHFEAVPIEVLPVHAAHDAVVPQAAGNANQPTDVNEMVMAASRTYHLDPDLVNSVIRAESGFNVRAVSPKGAQGLMQLMPQTASQLGVQNAFDPQANIDGGTRYLRELFERYNFDPIKALAAYNAGPRRVEQYGGVPPYYETKAYVARIVRDFNKKKLAEKSAEQSTSPHKSATPSKATVKTNTKPATKASGAPPRVEAHVVAPQ
jgi:soluble lytic murein transglycosylase-like protein